MFLEIIFSSSSHPSACSHFSPSKLFLVLAIWPQRIFLRENTHRHIPLKIWWRNPVVGGVGKEIWAQKIYQDGPPSQIFYLIGPIGLLTLLEQKF